MVTVTYIIKEWDYGVLYKAKEVGSDHDGVDLKANIFVGGYFILLVIKINRNQAAHVG